MDATMRDSGSAGIRRMISDTHGGSSVVGGAEMCLQETADHDGTTHVPKTPGTTGNYTIKNKGVREAGKDSCNASSQEMETTYGQRRQGQEHEVEPGRGHGRPRHL